MTKIITSDFSSQPSCVDVVDVDDLQSVFHAISRNRLSNSANDERDAFKAVNSHAMCYLCRVKDIKWIQQWIKRQYRIPCADF